jgi:hypothetical protein
MKLLLNRFRNPEVISPGLWTIGVVYVRVGGRSYRPLTAEERSELRLAEVQGHLQRTRRRRAG